MPAAPLISGRLHRPGALARPGRSPVVCARADRALAFCPRGHPLVHNEASPEVPGARRRRASSDFLATFGESGREIWLARAKVGVQTRGLRNRRSEVRILSGALWHVDFALLERRWRHRRSSVRCRSVESRYRPRLIFWRPFLATCVRFRPAPRPAWKRRLHRRTRDAGRGRREVSGSPSRRR
jgi:hypothetical protein